jgi:hypothetical protein
MGHPNLGINVNELPDLLDGPYFDRVLQGCIGHASKEDAKLFQNVIDKNYQEWIKNNQPSEIQGYYESNMPNDIYSISYQKVSIFLKFVKNKKS